MPQVRYDSRLVDSRSLAEFCGHLLAAAGVDLANAQLVAASLVEANLRGIDSHGVARLPHYLSRIRHGSINPQPQIETRRLAPAAAAVDGDDGLGQLVMQRATETAIELAESSGAGWVTVSRSSHCGALAFFGLQVAEAGMIGLVFTHVDPMVLPYGSREAFCGTNPICITAPRSPDGASELQSGALCLDMATSKVPWNTVANAAMEGVPIESGWAVDTEGNDTTDARSVASLYPFGSYKGSGLGLMIDVLCAMLSDAPFGPDIPKMYGDLTQPRQLGGMVGAIDIKRFVSLRRFHTRVAELIQRWGALPPSEPGGRVLYPGEPELIERRQRLREGIPMGLQLLKEFDELAGSYRLEETASELLRPIGVPTGPHVPAKRHHDVKSSQ